jgi:carboxyl-terminal processing protease
VPVRNVQILVFAIFVCVACYVQARRMKYGGRIGLAIETIENNFVDPVTADQLYEAAMKGLLDLDPYSEFITPQDYVDFQVMIEQHFGGLGILIEGPPNVKRLTVVTPLHGSPAYQAGIQPGDVITHVDGESTRDLTTEEARTQMRGPIGTSVTLTIERIGRAEPLHVTLTRDDINVDSVVGDHIEADSTWNYFLAEEPTVAYVRINLFGERTAREFRDALKKIQPQARALIIDLRFNPGGVMSSAIAMCDMLIDRGTIVSTAGRRWRFNDRATATPDIQFPLDIPIIVLQNNLSASASEIMAACLQDNGRARIAGERSFGKGTVQQVFELQNDQTAIKFTVARYMRPSGENINRTPEMKPEDVWGVKPEPEFALDLTDTQKVYLFRRWQQLGDPRLMGEERPPRPEFAGDPQLRKVMQLLRQELPPLQ